MITRSVSITLTHIFFFTGKFQNRIESRHAGNASACITKRRQKQYFIIILYLMYYYYYSRFIDDTS